MSTVKELVVPVTDLRQVSVECGYCHALMTVDILAGQIDVTHCVACHRDFGPQIKQGLGDLARLCVREKDAQHKLSLRLPVVE